MSHDRRNPIPVKARVSSKKPVRQFVPANDPLLFSELEKRYGGAFAQWVIDGMKRAERA